MRLAVSPTSGGDFRGSQSVGSAAGGRGGAGPAERHVPGDPPSGPHARRSEQGGPRYGPTLPAGLITSWGRGQHSVPAPNPTHPSVRPRPGRRPFPCDPGRGRVRLEASQHPEEDSWTLRCPSKRAWPNGLAKASQVRRPWAHNRVFLGRWVVAPCASQVRAPRGPPSFVPGPSRWRSRPLFPPPRLPPGAPDPVFPREVRSRVHGTHGLQIRPEAPRGHRATEATTARTAASAAAAQIGRRGPGDRRAWGWRAAGGDCNAGMGRERLCGMQIGVRGCPHVAGRGLTARPEQV